MAYQGTSIVDYLKSEGRDSSFSALAFRSSGRRRFRNSSLRAMQCCSAVSAASVSFWNLLRGLARLRRSWFIFLSCSSLFSS